MFNTYIAVDWSAKNGPTSLKPSADAIWVGVKETASGRQFEKYFRTRFECYTYIISYLQKAATDGSNIIIGYDFDFGFPRGLAKSMGYDGDQPWRFIWDFVSNEIEDTESNVNNRFEVASKINSIVTQGNGFGPLWGCPRNMKLDYLAPTSPEYPFLSANACQLRKKRWCEHREIKAQPVWKLIGTASVGGQSLVGIPILNKLRNHPTLEHMSAIWPFETGFGLDETVRSSPFILHIEIWPGILTRFLDATVGIRDQAQVRRTVNWLHEWDSAGKISQLMSPPQWLDSEKIDDAVKEEGWVVGSGLEGNIFPTLQSKDSCEQGILL
jgi:hypothetical protein